MGIDHYCNNWHSLAGPSFLPQPKQQKILAGEIESVQVVVNFELNNLRILLTCMLAWSFYWCIYSISDMVHCSDTPYL